MRDSEFIPLIRVTDDAQYELGGVEHVANAVYASIQSTMDEMATRHAQGKIPAHPVTQTQRPMCAWLFVIDHISDMRWTLESPQRFACYSCFCARRACMLSLGGKRWLLLPVPPQTREDQLAWTDPGYYLREGPGSGKDLAHLWQEMKRSRKRKSTGPA